MPQLFLTLLFWVIHWLIALPAALAAATPYVLIAAMFSTDTYWDTVTDYYQRLCRSFARFWCDMGHEFTP